MDEIEEIYVVHATRQTLNNRFTRLANAARGRVANVSVRQRRRASIGSGIPRNHNFGNQFLVEQLARRLELHARREALRQRLNMGQGGLRRFGSDGNLPGLRRSNSCGNLSQQNRNRPWRQSNGNLSQSSLFSNLNNAWRARIQRGFRRRGGQRGRGRVQRRVGVMSRGAAQYRAQSRPRGRGTGAQGRGRGRGRGLTRSQSQNRLLLSKEELDAQLDNYMACTKAVLDQQLDNYMKNAMESE